MYTRLRGWLAAVLATLIMLALVFIELADAGQRRWWAAHPLTTDTVSSVIDGSGDRGVASEGFRTYMMMLLISAPVLIDDPVARRFLEQAQYLGGVMAGTLARTGRSTGGAAGPGDSLDEAIRQLHSAAAPFLQVLSPGMRDFIQSVGRTAVE